AQRYQVVDVELERVVVGLLVVRAGPVAADYLALAGHLDVVAVALEYHVARVAATALRGPDVELGPAVPVHRAGRADRERLEVLGRLRGRCRHRFGRGR